MRRRSGRQESWSSVDENSRMRGDRRCSSRDLGKRKRDLAEETALVDRKYRRREEELVSSRTSRSVIVNSSSFL